jgi:uncharacterized protein (DUF488 family)
MIYTIGYSAFTLDEFKEILTTRGITTVVDVRSLPQSSYFQSYNRDELPGLLREIGVNYVFLGDSLGARPSDPTVYRNGRVDFRLLFESEAFRSGISRLCLAGRLSSLVLMCGEKDPATCHRSLLVARALSDKGLSVQHILSGGDVEYHSDLVLRILREHKVDFDIFVPIEENLALAYDLRGQAIFSEHS